MRVYPDKTLYRSRYGAFSYLLVENSLLAFDDQSQTDRSLKSTMFQRYRKRRIKCLHHRIKDIKCKNCGFPVADELYDESQSGRILLEIYPECVLCGLPSGL